MRVLSPAVRARVGGWLRATDLDLIAGLLLLVLMLLAFLRLAEEVGQEPISIDERILLALRDPVDPSHPLGGPVVEGMVRDVTALGSGTLAILFASAFVGWLLLTGRPGAAIFVVLAMLGAWGLHEGLKDAFGRERPDIVPHLRSSTDSFPSGHTMVSAVLYPTIAELLGRLVRQRRARFYLMSGAIALALLVAGSRVYLAVHYPTDVLGGLSAGFAWALVCGIAARLLQRRHVFRSQPRDRVDAEAEEVATP